MQLRRAQSSSAAHTAPQSLSPRDALAASSSAHAASRGSSTAQMINRARSRRRCVYFWTPQCAPCGVCAQVCNKLVGHYARPWGFRRTSPNFSVPRCPPSHRDHLCCSFTKAACRRSLRARKVCTPTTRRATRTQKRPERSSRSQSPTRRCARTYRRLGLRRSMPGTGASTWSLSPAMTLKVRMLS